MNTVPKASFVSPSVERAEDAAATRPNSNPDQNLRPAAPQQQERDGGKVVSIPLYQRYTRFY